jgi:hypothetical protein
MSDELKNINLEDDSLSQQEMQDYLDGKLSGKALRRVELILAESEFCSDAIEGLQLLNEQEINSSVKSIHSKIDTISKEEKKIFPIYRRLLSAAAIVIVLLIGGFYINTLFKNTKTEVSQDLKEINKPTIVNTDSIPVTDTFKNIIKYTAPSVNSNSITINESLQESPAPAEPPVVFAPSENRKENEVYADSEDDYDKKGEREDISVNIDPKIVTEERDVNAFITSSGSTTLSSPSSPSVNSNTYLWKTDSMINNDNSTLESVTITSKKETKNLKDKTISEKAPSQFDSNSINQNIESTDIIFNRALDLKINKQYQKSVDELTKIIIRNDSFKPHALYEKADVLILMNKKDKAKEVLEELIKIDSDYKQMGIDKLKTL